ncbi:MAG: hypothetical protein LUC44_01420 [Prevotellaceae bacterium]|nr:hypothetical protein [Prevotellaceae bacterium]
MTMKNRKIRHWIAVIALLSPTVHALAQTVTVTWGGDDNGGALGETSVNPLNAVSVSDYSKTNLTAYTGESVTGYTVLVPSDTDDNTADLTFGITHDQSDYADYNISPTTISFTAYAEGGEDNVYADVYLVYKGAETLVKENVPISSERGNPTTYSHSLDGVTLISGQSYEVKLEFKWTSESLNSSDDDEGKSWTSPEEEGDDDESGSSTSKSHTIEDGGTYMLQDVNTGYYVAGGGSDGLTAVLLPQPQQITFTSADNNSYYFTSYQWDWASGYSTANYLSSTDAGYSFGTALWGDNYSLDTYSLTPINSDEGTYYLSGANNSYYYLVAGNEYEAVTHSNSSAAATVFRVFSQEDLVEDQKTATSANPVDVTGLIWNPTLNYLSESLEWRNGPTYWKKRDYNNSYDISTVLFGAESKYSYTDDDGNDVYENVVAGANVATVTSPGTNGFNVYQTLTTKLKAGKYTFSAQGYYYLSSGTSNGNTVIYATPGSSTTMTGAFMALSDATGSSTSAMSGASPTNAYTDFKAGLYPMEVSFTVDEDDTEVTLGFKGNDASASYYWGELKLMYYGVTQEPNTTVHECDDDVGDWEITEGTGELTSKDGYVVYQVESGTEATISHTQLTDLLYGKYLVTVKANSLDSDGEDTMPEGTTFTANGTEMHLTSGGTTAIVCDVGTDGTLDISFEISDEATYSTLEWNSLKVVYIGSQLLELTALEGKMNSEIDEAQKEAVEAYNYDMTADNYLTAYLAMEKAQASIDYYASVKAVVDALDEAGLAAWEETSSYTKYAGNTLDDDDDVSQLHEDLAAAQKAQSTPGSDMTYVALYDSEWTGEGVTTETSGTTAVTGKNDTEYSADDDALCCTITGLNAGYYTISFYAIENATTAGVSSGENIAQAFAVGSAGGDRSTKDMTVGTNDDLSSISSSDIYTITVYVDETGTLEFGIQNIADGGDWAACQVVSLTYNVVERCVALSEVTIENDLVEGTYLGTFGSTSVREVSIQHKPAKWHSIREEKGEEYNDDFSDGEKWKNIGTEDNPYNLQATHEYTDTMYVQKGTKVALYMPTHGGWYTSSHTGSYQRWFNYLNDKNYYCNGYALNDNTDLITPHYENAKAWRFENGYVTGALNSQYGTGYANEGDTYYYGMPWAYFYYPTDEEYEEYLEGSENFKDLSDGNLSNDYYAVACEASIYRDFSETSTGHTDFGSSIDYFCEPTLAQRTVFYLIGVDEDQADADGKYVAPDDVPDEYKDYWEMLSDPEYQDDGTKYLEEYEITVPSRRVTDNTNELVALSKDARAYGIPGESSPGEVKAEIGSDNTAKISLCTSSLYDTDRVIYYYVGESGSAWEVDDGSTATIVVTKTVNDIKYHIARYKLTFKDDCVPLTEPQVDELDKKDASSYWWGTMNYRSKQYLEDNYKLIASRKFDYSSEHNSSAELGNGASSATYPYPLGWEESGFAFSDGSSTDYSSGDAISNSGPMNTDINWGMYGIENQYYGYGDINNTNCSEPQHSSKTAGGDDYWLYVDATQTPSKLVDLNLGSICQGSQIVATAWIKSTGEKEKDDAAVMFIINGVTADGEEVPRYRQYSGQIRTTTYIEKFISEESDATTKPEVYGKGTGTNEWFQVYLTFTTTSDRFDHYTFRMDNCCASTQGGDFYLDDVCVYVQQPTPAAQEVTPVETDHMAEVRLDLDYEAMLGRALGTKPSDYDETSEDKVTVGFIMLDKVKYDEEMLNVNTSEANYYEEKAEAIKNSAVKFYTSEGYTGDAVYFETMTFYCYYNKNPEYDENDPSSYGKLCRLTENGRDLLCTTLYTDASPYTPYLIVAETINDENGDSGSDEEWYEYFAENIGDKCSIEAVFAVTDATRVWINGELADATLTHCAGQVYHIAPTVTYEKDDGSLQPVSGVYYDFFYGTDDEFTSAEDNSPSLETALLHFRQDHKTAEALVEPAEDDETYTEEDYEIIQSYENRISFYRQYIDITVPDKDEENGSVGGIRLVIRPIETTIYDEENEEVTATSWDFLTVKMEISGSGPTTVYTGFEGIGDYPGDYMPALRIGKDQAEGVTSSESALTIELRDGASGLSIRDKWDGLYLVDTNDPDYMYGDYGMFQDDFDQYSLPISEVQSFLSDGGNNMQIYFDQENYPFKEGYYYAVVVHYKDEETTESEDDDEGICYGVLPMEIKIVPKYLVWQGGDEGNWNKDDNWAMAEDGESLIYGGEYTTRSGYVPMKFSKVVIPEDKAVELYIDGFTQKDSEQEDNKWEWADYFGTDESKKPAYVTESPTANIMYDMMAYQEDESDGESGEESGSSLTTGRYRVNICDQIHFEPGAMMLHPELLDYEKAWTDVKIPGGKWTLVSTPLQGVVSGDWYTKVSGTETAPYFTDLYFTGKDGTESTETEGDNSGDGEGEDEASTDYNDREELMVFQRSWGNDTQIVYTDNDKENVDAPVYSSTGWTSVYNDASVSQQAGEGFSIKAYGNSDELIFRFPKEDGSHVVSSTTLDRTDAGKFLISSGLTETDDDGVIQYAYDGKVSVTLTPSTDGYAIVGNPFTAYLSLKAFLDGNSNVDGYWLESTKGPIVGGGGTTSWGTEDYFLEPYGAFFVKFSGSDYTVTFTEDMQTLGSTDETKTTSFSIRAEGEGGMSGAAVAYDVDASDEYSSSEDAMLMEDDSWKKDDLPLVYTVAGDKAVSINRLRGLTVIPLGVFASDDSEYTLTFTGVDFLGEPSLYDAETDTETPLTEGYTLDMQGASHGRYFIKTAADVTEAEDGLYNVSAYSTDHRRVTVSSNAEIERVDVYSVGGMLQRRVFPNSVACTIDGIESGVAVVRIQTSEGVTIRKITVR